VKNMKKMEAGGTGYFNKVFKISLY